MIRARRRSIYCSPAEWAEITERARSAGMKNSPFVIACALAEDQEVEARYPAGADGGGAENAVRQGGVPRPLHPGDVRAPAGKRPLHV